MTDIQLEKKGDCSKKTNRRMERKFKHKNDFIFNLIADSCKIELIKQIIEINIENLKNIPKLYGVYVLIYKTGRKPYVGSTTVLHKRLVQHRCSSKHIISYILFFETEAEDILVLENWLISNLKCSNKIRAIGEKR